MYAVAPNGAAIIGTLERTTARADISADSFRLTEDGVEFDHAGYTEIFWEEMKTVERMGRRVFLDDEGNEWLEDELTLYDDPEGGCAPCATS